MLSAPLRVSARLNPSIAILQGLLSILRVRKLLYKLASKPGLEVIKSVIIGIYNSTIPTALSKSNSPPIYSFIPSVHTSSLNHNSTTTIAAMHLSSLLSALLAPALVACAPATTEPRQVGHTHVTIQGDTGDIAARQTNGHTHIIIQGDSEGAGAAVARRQVIGHTHVTVQGKGQAGDGVAARQITGHTHVTIQGNSEGAGTAVARRRVAARDSVSNKGKGKQQG